MHSIFDAFENCHSCHCVVRSWYYFKNLSIALHITMGFNCKFSSGKSAVESFLCCFNLPRNYFMHEYLQCAYTTTTIATAWSNVQLFGSSHCAGRFKCINAVAASLSFFHVGIHSAKLHLYIYIWNAFQNFTFKHSWTFFVVKIWNSHIINNNKMYSMNCVIVSILCWK